MKTRAAVAWEAGKPLEIEEIELAGPKKGEVLVGLEEAKRFVKSESLEGDTTLLQRCELLKI